MSFRKRNMVIGVSRTTTEPQPNLLPKTGIRPSALDGRPTTSTGTTSLDQLLGGHAGLPLGTSILVEETGNTEFGGILLRYYAAEGLVQGHSVHVLGHGESWRRELPGLSTKSKSKSTSTPEVSDSKMKIAWRYETLGGRAAPTGNSATGTNTAGPIPEETSPFCHDFDITKRLDQGTVIGELYTTPAISAPGRTVFQHFIKEIVAKMEVSPSKVHRIVVPNLLSTTIFGSDTCRPQEVLQFLHALRAVLRRFNNQASAMISVPITLFPRSSGLMRWAELLFDGVLELIPLQYQHHFDPAPNSKKEEKSQGMMRVHSLPIFHEKGGGAEGTWVKEDLSFKLSASSGLVITPFSLPPVGEQHDDSASKADASKANLEF